MAVVENLELWDEQSKKNSDSISEKEPPPPGTEEDFVDVPTQASLCSLVDKSSALDDEHEEGEIEDDEDGGVLEYEDISSEEEVTIRERIAQLEAMDDELRKINQITGVNNDENGHFAHDKPAVLDSQKTAGYECISDEEDVEMYLRQYDPIPKPKLLPARRRKLRPLRAGTQRLLRSSSSSRKHGESKRRVDKRKHEPKSARKSDMHRTRHKRRRQHASTMINIGDTSDSDEDFPLDRARLQAACNINAGKRKTDKENWDALKQKLKHSLEKRKQKQSETNKEVRILPDESMVLVVDDEEEDDEEVLQLRLQALKSKAEIKETGVISLLDDPVLPETVAEEQQLRMIALRSAFTKKHEIRQKRKQGERPYSPSDELFLFTSPIEEEDDDEVQIVETHPETVEIPDSSSDEENRMEISPEPQCPNPPEISQAIDMELATSGESRSPMLLAVSQEQTTDTKDEYLELEPPPPPIISADLQNTLPVNDDEESLRTHLLSNFSTEVTKSAPVESRPTTPDSVSEEEANALRELILSKMYKKASNKQVSSTNEGNITIKDREKTDTYDIPNETKENDPYAVPSIMEPLTISINNVDLPIQPDSSKTPSPALNNMIPTNQSKVQSHPNLITLIGKQKITRKKRKKSSSASMIASSAKMSLPQVQQHVSTNNQVLAIAVPLPSRTLIKAPVVQKPLPPLSVPPKIMVTTKKLVNNPNKLINLNAPIQPTLVSSTKERSTMLENYVQKPVAKMVIQVGNSDSDSDPDYYPAPDPVPNPIIEREEHRVREAFLRDMDNTSPSRVMLESPTYSSAPVTPTSATEMDSVESHPVATGSEDAAFEQRLDHFLRTVRSKIDQSRTTGNVVGTGVPVEAATVTVVASTAPTGGSSSCGREAATMRTAKKPITAPAAPITPLAVRHLPKSAQLEYRRLVARMALLEKQKQQRIVAQTQSRPTAASSLPPKPSGLLHPLTKTILNTGPDETKDAHKNHDIVVTVNHDRRDVVSKVSQQMSKRVPDPLVKRVLINNTVLAERDVIVQGGDNKASENRPPDVESVPNRQNNANQDPEVASLREALRRLPLLKEEDRQKMLKVAEHRFQKHSEKFTQDLRELIGTIEHAQQERQKQYDLENKVAFLKEKLAVLERALSLHKQKLDDIFPALQDSHTKVLASRKRSAELNDICLAVGRGIQGPSYIPPISARNEIHEQLKVLTTETKRLKGMKRLSLDEFKQLTAEQRRIQHEKQKNEIEEQLVKSGTSDPEKRPPSAEPSVMQAECLNSVAETKTEFDTETKEHAKSAPASRSVSPSAVTSHEKHGVTQEAPAALEWDNKSQFKQYTSPLASLKNQSALNIPDGVICPYQMRGECIDQDCKFDHFK